MKLLKIALVFFLLFGCGRPVYHLPTQTKAAPKKLLVFIDGTGNDESSHTNVAKLYNLVTLQENENIIAIYIEGVGTKGKAIGLAMGWGIGEDVRNAYKFIANNYDKKRGDEIYIFGFSRGAYASRILSGLIDLAGVLDLSKLNEKEQNSILKKLYKIYKQKNTTVDLIKQTVKNKFKDITTQNNVQIEFMGLWDTVSALGLPNSKEDYIKPNKKYNDQLCNVKKAAHALALNDQRAYLFTPILLTEKHLISNCNAPIDINKKVDEVWFFGAHSDVGGGYKNSFIPNYSFNWMLSKIKDYNIIDKGIKLHENFSSESHNGRYFIMNLISRNRDRNLKMYSQNSPYNYGKLKIHYSVLEKLKQGDLKPFEINIVNTFSKCFSKNSLGGYDKISDACFDIIN